MHIYTLVVHSHEQQSNISTQSDLAVEQSQTLKTKWMKKIENENNWELIIQFYESFLFSVAQADDHLIPVFIESDSNFESTPHQNGCNKITRNYCVWRKKEYSLGP